MVDAGEDTEFGVDPEVLKLNGIKEPPFYAFKYINGFNLATVGLKTNERLQALSAETGAPIPGLYTAGNMQGNFFRKKYDHALAGWSLGHAKISGVLAVKSALGTLDEEI